MFIDDDDVSCHTNNLIIFQYTIFNGLSAGSTVLTIDDEMRNNMAIFSSSLLINKYFTTKTRGKFQT